MTDENSQNEQNYELVDRSIFVLVAFVRSVQLQRALLEVDQLPNLNFWRLISGHCMDMAAIDWCKLFGSDKNRRRSVHWKNLIPQCKQNKFREELLNTLNFCELDWIKYRKHVKSYRDKHVAHLDLKYNNSCSYPDYKPALSAAFLYYEYLLKQIQIEHGYPKDLCKYSTSFLDQSENIAKLAMNATADIEENIF